MTDIVTDFTAIARRMKEIQGKPFNPPAKLGVEEGETCNRDGCSGVLRLTKIVDCSCHLHPPCHACLSQHEECPVCGWEYEE